MKHFRDYIDHTTNPQHYINKHMPSAQSSASSYSGVNSDNYKYSRDYQPSSTHYQYSSPIQTADDANRLLPLVGSSEFTPSGYGYSGGYPNLQPNPYPSSYPGPYPNPHQQPIGGYPFQTNYPSYGAHPSQIQYQQPHRGSGLPRDDFW